MNLKTIINFEKQMITDRQRIEHALIPALFESYFLPLYKLEKPKHQKTMDILSNEYRKYLNSDARLFRRMDRIANKIIRYTVTNKFDSRKAFLTVSSWLGALLEAEALIIDGSDYVSWLEELGEIIRSGYKVIDGFEKIDASAIKHVPKLHAIAQSEGYFI